MQGEFCSSQQRRYSEQSKKKGINCKEPIARKM